MIQFLTLVLSLHVGILPVEVAVADPVERVEMYLNGELVAQRSAPPWTFQVDLGRELRPHRLDAIAFDQKGHELERVSQRINYARGHSEASLVLDAPVLDQPRRGQVVWATTDRSAPKDIALTFNGRPVELSAQGHFQLPDYDASQAHHLKAALQFPDLHVTETDAVLGGTLGDELTSALTAVPLTSKNGQLPDSDTLSRWIEVRNRPGRVFSVPEEGRSVVIVRDYHVNPNLRKLMRTRQHPELSQASRILQPEDRVEFLLPFNLAPDPHGVHRPIPVRQEINKLGLWNHMSVNYPAVRIPRKQNLWWSVALAGKRVADQGRPRAVVLVLSSKPRTHPALSFQQAEDFLQSLRVPLVVWAPKPETFERLDITPDRGYTGVDGMLQLFDDLGTLLNQQTMVWIQGEHLPTDIALNEAAPDDVAIAR